MPRRLPVPVLRPSLDHCKPTGIRLNESSRVLVAADAGGVGAALSKRLQKRGVTVLPLAAGLAPEALAAQVEAWRQAGPIHGVYWLPALDAGPDLSQMDLAVWRQANRIRVKNLALTMRLLYDEIKTAGTFLVTAVRLGGLHGYGPEPALDPLGGGVTGFSKAYKRERPDALVKTVDFEASRKTAALADRLIAETERDPGVVEVGYWRERRFTVGLAEQPAHGRDDLTLDANTVFLVTGAAGGITSAIVADLAAASGGIFYLLDLTPAPERADPQIARFRQDREGLKQQLIAEARAAGEKPTPVLIEKKLAALERAEAALSAIEAVEAAGGTAVYRRLDLLDGAAVTAVVAEIRETYGRIDVLVHAGGIEISKSLNQKEAAQFALVFDIKADGFFSLLHAAEGLPIGATVAFSSVAGRFGNAGQTDYSAANDLLCKLTSHLRRLRPQTKAIAIDWTAWGEIGMATRGSIPKIMSMAGIEMLPPAVGIPTTRRELLRGDGGEVLVAGSLGVLVAEWDEAGGLDPSLSQTEVLAGRITAAHVYGGWQAETVLDPNEQPFLRDHALDGTPLLPGVMGTEAFARLARQMAPGYQVTAVTGETFHAPLKFYRLEPQTLIWRATAVPGAEELLVQAALHSRRELKSGVQEKLHFTATVRLRRQAPAADPVSFTPPAAFSIGAEAIYNLYFHGPAYRVLDGVQVEGNRAIGRLALNLPPHVHPPGAPELLAPRLVELCFQTAGVWQIRTRGEMALPLALDAVTAYRQEKEADGRLYAMVEAVNGGETFNARVVDESGVVYVSLTGYRTVLLGSRVSLPG